MIQNRRSRAMVARALRRPLSGLGSCACQLGGAGGRAPAPGPGLEFESPGQAADVPYEAAKRMRLGALGLATSGPPVGQGAGAGAAIGATQGASYGAVAGPIGAAIGFVIGAIGGAIAGSINKRDPEQYNFDQAVAIWGQNPNNVYEIGNKYLPIAGLFDLNLDRSCSSRWCIPMYVKYGHMGEQKFVTDLVNVIYRAGLTGQITASDTPLTVMQKVVQPWIDSWGYGNLNDPHADLINKLIVGMILDYVSGAWKTSWRAQGGDFPFGALPDFKLPGAAAAPPPISQQSTGNPLPVVSTPTPVAVPAGGAPAAPASVFSSDGSSVTTPGVGLAAQGHIFYFGNQIPGDKGNAYGFPVYVDGKAQGYLVGMKLANGGQVYGQNGGDPASGGKSWFQWNGNGWSVLAGPPNTGSTPSCTAPLVWNGTQCVQYMQLQADPGYALPPLAPAPPAGLVPSGFNQVATDSAGGPVFANAQGVLYKWNGQAMQQFTGQLASGASQAAQLQAAIQQALAQGFSANQAAQTALAQQQAAGNPVPPAYQAQAAAQADTTAAAPTVATAGFGGSLGGVGGLVAVGLGVLGLLFATARPAKAGASANA